jgi:O-acetyl-ADP-ribose deacetylase
MSAIFESKYGTIELLLGNIVEQNVDVIVNAANTKLKGGGGVDGAIHRAAGSTLLEECLKLPVDNRGQRCPTGEAKITGAGNLQSKYVIHTVGPFFNQKYYEKSVLQLEKAYLNSLILADTQKCHSIAFPSISTGAYRFPVEIAAKIALQTTRDFLQQKTSVELVKFVLYKPNILSIFESELLLLDRIPN